jgi:hypothetical protein
MKKVFFLFSLAPLFLFSQKWNDRANSGDGLVGISIGFLIEGQTKYPTTYYGPQRTGFYNDGAYHLTLDIYYNKFILGIQFAEEFLYLEKFNQGGVWKPRGFNNSFSSLTRSYWINLGYNVFYNFNFKLGVGHRRGPQRQLIHRGSTASEVAFGYDYTDPNSPYNTRSSLNTYNEFDYSLSIAYPLRVYGKFGLVPALGYNVKYGGFLTGLSVIY